MVNILIRKLILPDIIDLLIEYCLNCNNCLYRLYQRVFKYHRYIIGTIDHKLYTILRRGIPLHCCIIIYLNWGFLYVVLNFLGTS